MDLPPYECCTIVDRYDYYDMKKYNPELYADIEKISVLDMLIKTLQHSPSYKNGDADLMAIMIYLVDERAILCAKHGLQTK